MQDVILLSREDLEAAFKKWTAEVNTPQDDELLGAHGLADYLERSIHWVYRGNSLKKKDDSFNFPPSLRRSGKLLFRKSDVDKWLGGKE